MRELGLPPELTFFERGWLSANNMLFAGEGGSALVDSGYCTHGAQTLALVRHALGTRALDLLVNTHLHSDHCGGNAALRAAYPALRTLIPPGEARAVRDWDEAALSFAPTGQQCPRFAFDAVLVPGRAIRLGARDWQVHAAPGHDPHSVLLFEPASRTLISADALWQNGFGVVFPEIEGAGGFDEVAATLDLIESLAPRIVLPGHGAAFDDVGQALARARSRLDGFVQNPQKHTAHAAKVLLKFKLLELQRTPLGDFVRWAAATRYVALLHASHAAQQARAGPAAAVAAPSQPAAEWVAALIDELVRAGAAERRGGLLLDRG